MSPNNPLPNVTRAYRLAVTSIHFSLPSLPPVVIRPLLWSRSLGVAVILGNLTGADTGISGLSFQQAADQEIAFLLNSVPRAPNGAISHRVSEVGFHGSASVIGWLCSLSSSAGGVYELTLWPAVGIVVE